MRTLAPLLVLFALAACRTPAGESVPPPDPTVAEAGGLTFPNGPHRYTCAQGRAFEVTFLTPDTVRVSLDGRTLTLPHALSADGARYSDGTVVAWFKGMRDGFIQENGVTTYADCRRAE